MKKVLGIDEIKIAQCVGLWLAEGDRKSNHELTFTNNSKELIKFFHNAIMKISVVSGLLCPSNA